MTSSLPSLRSRAGVVLLVIASTWAATGQVKSARPSQQNPTQAGFERLYNLEYDHAIQLFQQVVKKQPNDPMAVNHLLTAILFKELYRMGALTTGDFANDSFLSIAHQPADPAVKEQVRDLVARAQTLEEEKLKTSPNDVQALYARANTRAQYSTYLALMERAWFSALRNAVGARHDDELVLELSPEYSDAKLIVGAHQYVVGSLPWAVRAAVSVAGLGGNKQKGLQYLRECANANTEASVDAKILLALFLRRERQYPEAMALVKELEARYPGNILLTLEEGNLLRSEGKYQESAAVYAKIFEDGTRGRYPDLHYEIAAVSLGDLLRAQKNYSAAAAAYDRVATVAHPDQELLQKSELGAGEMYDVLQKRDIALQKYQSVISADASTPLADSARRYLKEAYRAD